MATLKKWNTVNGGYEGGKSMKTFYLVEFAVMSFFIILWIILSPTAFCETILFKDLSSVRDIIAGILIWAYIIGYIVIVLLLANNL